ncbi:sensor domain-containing diguanylate cyclase [Pseudomonas abieticivorans]|uniref:sensor domain-containing diguanylate cyclase n=1 Tax=Pseudomonas abieticivorans TaxID=2931382 RepID=UPI0020BDB077|nr:sensor domain-containing diguanylate cyclase [Pseudomonas sp. PIA16]
MQICLDTDDEYPMPTRLLDDLQALRDNERRLALAIAGSGTGIWDRNFLTNEIHYSAGWKAIIGYAEDELSNRIEDAYDRLHPDDRDYVQATIRAHFEQRTDTYEVEHRIRCKDGSYKWICSRGKVIARDADGQALRMVGTTTDITTLRALSGRLQQTLDLVTNLTNEVPGLVFQYRLPLDGQAFFSYASAGVEDIYEVTAQQVAECARLIEQRIHPDDLALYQASLLHSARCQSPWHVEYRVILPRQGLRWRQGDARPQRLTDGSTQWHGFITDITERKRIEAELQEFATIDFLTQLPNRRHFMQQIDTQLQHIQHSRGRMCAVLMCDLDHFKRVNDRWGHAVGDRALKHFAAVLKTQLRHSDIAGRMGGEEFAVVLSGAHVLDALAFAERLQAALLATPFTEAGQVIPLTLSIGVSVMGATDSSPDLALSRSDQALYRAKENGRDRIEAFCV